MPKNQRLLKFPVVTFYGYMIILIVQYLLLERQLPPSSPEFLSHSYLAVMVLGLCFIAKRMTQSSRNRRRKQDQHHFSCHVSDAILLQQWWQTPSHGGPKLKAQFRSGVEQEKHLFNRLKLNVFLT